MPLKGEIIWYAPSEGLPPTGEQVFIVYKKRFRTVRMGRIDGECMFMDATICIPVDEASYWAYPNLLLDMENA